MTEDEMVGWHHRLNDLSLGKLREIAKNREAWGAAVHGVTESKGMSASKLRERVKDIEA